MRTEIPCRALALLAMVPAVMVLDPVAPALAADGGGLEFSRDGTTWSSTLAGPVLDEDVRLVPGGSTRSDVWVRNSSEHATTLTTTLRDTRSSMPAGTSAGEDFRVRVGGSRVSAAGAAGCHVHSTEDLDPGEQQRIPVSVSLPASSGNISENQAVSFTLRVHLVEGSQGDPCPSVPETPGVVSTDGGPGGSAPLEDTLLLVMGLVSATAAVLLRRRGRARSSRPTS